MGRGAERRVGAARVAPAMGLLAEQPGSTIRRAGEVFAA